MATARRFALTMGLTAMAVVCVAGIWRAAPLERTLLRALVALLLFAGIGYVCGLLGAVIMKDAVRTTLTRMKKIREGSWLGRAASKTGAGREGAGSGSASEENPGGARS